MIQINMQMPESCALCDFLKIPDTTDYFQCIPDGRYLYDEDKVWMTEKRPNWCPLKKQETIVRCKDCKISNMEKVFKNVPTSKEQVRWCELIQRYVDDDWFCADGVKRDD